MNRFIARLTGSRLALAGVFMLVALAGFTATFAMSKGSSAVTSTTKCQGTCVALQADGAKPDTITVTPGSYVQFNSADGKEHSLSLGDGGSEHEHKGSFSSGDFKADEAWRVQFKDEGSYIFHDHYNPDINVLVVVYTPGKDYKIE